MNLGYKPSNWKPGHSFKGERNHDLFIDRLYNGMSYKELSIKYGITMNRCRQIYERYQHLVNRGFLEE